MEDKREPCIIPGEGLLGFSLHDCHLAARPCELPSAALAGLCCWDRAAGVQQGGRLCFPDAALSWVNSAPKTVTLLSYFARLFVLLGVHPSS